MSIAVALIILVFGLAGVWWHWLNVVKRGGAGGFIGFADYLFTNDAVGSTKTLGAFLTAMSGLFAAGTFDQIQMGAFIDATKNGIIYAPLLGAIVTAFTTGYACDSKFNSNTSTTTTEGK